jgi:hypothetical protein
MPEQLTDDGAAFAEIKLPMDAPGFNEATAWPQDAPDQARGQMLRESDLPKLVDGATSLPPSPHRRFGDATGATEEPALLVLSTTQLGQPAASASAAVAELQNEVLDKGLPPGLQATPSRTSVSARSIGSIWNRRLRRGSAEGRSRLSAISLEQARHLSRRSVTGVPVRSPPAEPPAPLRRAVTDAPQHWAELLASDSVTSAADGPLEEPPRPEDGTVIALGSPPIVSWQSLQLSHKLPPPSPYSLPSAQDDMAAELKGPRSFHGTPPRPPPSIARSPTRVARAAVTSAPRIVGGFGASAARPQPQPPLPPVSSTPPSISPVQSQGAHHVLFAVNHYTTQQQVHLRLGICALIVR